MRPALPISAEDELFTPHRMGLATPQVIAQRLREVGLIVLDGLDSRDAVLALAGRVMNITLHRDSDAYGLTTIQNADHYPDRPGFAAFTSEELLPHTDRSGIPEPPRLMLLVCASPAGQGGECLLTDGRAVYAELYEQHREAADRLSEPMTAFFGAGDGAGGGHVTQVFTEHLHGRVSVRLRQDQLARWSPLVTPYLRHLQAALLGHQRSLPLAAGQGYLLDNTRWFHGRSSFTGQRRFWRVLGNPRFPLPPGFAPIRSMPDDHVSASCWRRHGR